MRSRLLLLVTILCFPYFAFAQFKLEKIFPGGEFIQFTSSTEGFSYGTTANNEIFHTTDAGYTWRLMASGIVNGLPVERMSFIDSTTAFAVAYDTGSSGLSYIYKTTDGGNTWQKIYTSVITSPSWNSKSVINCHFTDALHGWAVGNRTVIATTDGGNTWLEQLSITSPNAAWALDDLYFLDNNNGYITGEGGTILHTSDGGNNWTFQNLDTAGNSQGIAENLDCFYLEDVNFTDAQHGYIGANNGGYMTTVNGGLTWTKQVTNYPYDNEGTCMSDSNTLWLSGGPYCDNTGCYTNESILYNRNNSGWVALAANARVYDPGILGFGQIHFLNPTLGYASNSDGYVYRIIDTTATATNVKNVSAPLVSIYPDPATDNINLTFNSPLSGTIEVYNTIGQKMITVEERSTTHVNMDISSLPAGHYYLVLRGQQPIISSSFSKL